MDYIYRYDIAAIIVSVSILVSLIRNKTIHTRMVNTFEIWFIMIILSSVFDSLSIFLLKKPEIAPLAVYYLVNIGYHMAFIFIPQIFYYSIYFSTEDNKPFTIWKKALFSLPYLFIVIMLFLTPFTKAVFYFDENMVYHRGSLFVLTYCVAGFYIVSIIYRAIRYRKQFSQFQLFSIWFYMIFSLGTLVIQFFIPKLMLMNFAISVSSMIGYLSLENPSDYLDKEMPMYNRNGFVEYLNHYLYRRKEISILGLHIVGFKAMENAIGSKNKLDLLQQLGKDMLSVSPMNRNFRISQSRFAIILNDNPEKQKQQITDIINYSLQSFKINDVNLLISINSVLIKCPEDANSVDDIVELMEHSFDKNVTIKENEVSRADRNILLKNYEEHLMLEKIKNAINQGNFYVYYHPIFDAKQKKYNSAEALIRVKTNNDSIVSPEDFLPINEKSGMLIKIGEFILESVCRYIVDDKPYEHGIDFIVIKLSILQCMQKDLSRRILEIINLYKINPSYIHFCVSESSTLLAKDVLLENMKELQKNGFVFSLSEFGTGLSNIANIVKFPFSAIKIDKSLLNKALEEEKAAVILRENISMIKDMNLAIVADCSDDENITSLMLDLNCDYLQGYKCPLPLSTNAFTTFIYG